MDCVKLDSTTLKDEAMVEGWSSFIWTERFGGASGDFQLKTPRIKETMELIPEGSFISSSTKDEIMIVENHSIGTDDDGVAELTVTGPSFLDFLKQRFYEGYYKEPWQMQLNYTIQDALTVLLWSKLNNNTSWDVTRPPGPSNPAAWPHVAGDNIPMRVAQFIRLQKPVSALTPKDPADLQSTQEWYVETGDLYSKVIDLLNVGDLGIRCIKPNIFFSYGGVLPDPAVPNQKTVSSAGVISNAEKNANNAVVFQIYNGRNRTITGAPVGTHYEPVIFRRDVGHITSPSYLITGKERKNHIRVISNEGERDIYENGVVLTGLEKRSMLLDVGEVPVDSSEFLNNDYLAQKGMAAMKKHNRQVMIDGAISPGTMYPYNQFDEDWNDDRIKYNGYFLGDYVTVIGDYGVQEDMQVVEAISVHDKDGEKFYPTLIRKE